jgi:hypothetical protein
MDNDIRKWMLIVEDVWHGSPHRFDRFSTNHIGSGEGADAFGWGLYFSSERQVAEFYRDKLDGKYLYSVSIPSSDDYLDWRVPIKRQSPTLLAKLAADWPGGKSAFDEYLRYVYDMFGSTTGEAFYWSLKEIKHGDKRASLYLASLGIPGIKYLDAHSRSGGSNSYNYVIFCDENAVINQSHETK